MQVTYFHRRPRPNANYSIEQAFENVRQELAGRVEARVCEAPCISNGIIRRLRIAWHARSRQGEINHVTGDTNFTALSLDGRRTVLTNHDCGYLARTRGLRRQILKTFWLDWPVKRVAAVTTVSPQVKEEIVRLTGCAPEKVHVIPAAASAEFQPMPLSFNERRPRILHVGTAPNKNLPRLIDAIAGWPCVLAIVGRIDERTKAHLVAAKVQYENYVDLTTPQLLRQYGHCDIVSFPSLYEGFGVPVLEAQAVGRPLLTSNREPMKDIAGDGACLIDPTDVSAMRAGIERIAGDEEYRNELIAAGLENAKRFSWRRTAEMYLALYEHVLSEQALASRLDERESRGART
jgi:glycosyltransferase involved in cell wall biosynthesis